MVGGPENTSPCTRRYGTARYSDSRRVRWPLFCAGGPRPDPAESGAVGDQLAMMAPSVESHPDWGSGASRDGT
jgi:hypothetical protein